MAIVKIVNISYLNYHNDNDLKSLPLNCAGGEVSAIKGFNFDVCGTLIYKKKTPAYFHIRSSEHLSPCVSLWQIRIGVLPSRSKCQVELDVFTCVGCKCASVWVIVNIVREPVAELFLVVNTDIEYIPI